jgi:MYXO-CTERM domain-containing protein
MKRIDVSWTVIVAAIGSAFGCSGGGCDGMVPTPGGFPAAERTQHAGQVRVSQSGIAAVTSDPEALLGGLLGGSGLEFNVPPGCGGSPAICCPGGTPQEPCGPIVIDLAEQPGDAPRMEVHPVASGNVNGRLDVIVRARIHTQMDLPVDDIPLIGDCTVAIDTNPGADEDVRIDLPIDLLQDAAASTTRIVAGDAVLSQLTTDDVSINGGGLCFLADLGVGLFIDTLSSQFSDQIKGAINDQLCKACDSGDVADCGPFADTCDGNTCMKASGECLQELGIAGRVIGNVMLGSLSPGTTGGFDLYEVAGTYATTLSNGISLGLLGGMLPAGTERDRCGPPATAPAPVTIPRSTYFQGNTNPDNGQAFDIAIGLHQSQLDELAYAAYDGGFFCLTIGTRTIDLLTTDTLTLIASSLSEIVTETSPVFVGLRPQQPPVFVLGLNTFRDEGGEPVPDEPLLDITFTNMEIDFFASIDGHYVRLFTLVTDVHLPIGLQVADGELVPVIGAVDDAFTNVSVKNSESLSEDPADLAARFPSILQLALPQLGAGLSGFALPELGGLNLEVTNITAVDNKTFLAIFANIVPGMMARVETEASIRSIEEPDPAALNEPSTWRADNRPRVHLELGGQGLEYQVRTDDGMWSPWGTATSRVISPASFWIQGVHTIEVRARQAGVAGTIDPTPVVLQVPIGSIPSRQDESPGPKAFHGQAGEGGCDCSTGSASGGAPIVLALLAILWPRRRRAPRSRPARARRATPAWMWVGAVVLALAGGPGCSCNGGTKPCGELECMDGEVEHSSGKWNGAASDGTRTVVSTYDPQLGDLVVAEVAGSEYTLIAVDGIPDETPVYNPDTYRGGVVGEGPNVGAYSSIALAGGLARASYTDRDTGALRVAIESDDHDWTVYEVDDRGIHTSIAIDGNGAPVVAYLATGVPDGAGVKSELRLARASGASPSGPSDWTTAVVASAPASCAGACATGQACVEGANPGEETCITETNDCSPGCDSGDVCNAGSCVTEIDPPYVDLASGTGLFPTPVVLADGRIAIVYYDRTRTALVLAVESSPGGGSFSETVLDGANADDRGMWATAVTDGTTIHIGYQDALGDQVFYTSWSGGTPGAIELVDDGVRPGDRVHNVGAGAAIYLNGEPSIAYQDGMTHDVIVARRAGGTWSHAPVNGGLALDGFHIAATSSILVWDNLDHVRAPVDALVTIAAP